MFTRFFGSKQGNFVPLYHTQVMADSRANNFEIEVSFLSPQTRQLRVDATRMGRCG